MSQEKAQLIAPIENITVTGVVATGVITATSFEGNVTGSASSIIQGANIVAGIVTAGLNTTTAFSGNLTGNAGGLSGDPDIHVGVLSATSFVGNVTGIVTGRATGLSNTGAGTSNLNIGTFTATTFHGDGSGLTGVAGAAFSQQSIGITSATTAIDLSNGNVIHANQSADTTVSFANTAGSNEIYFIREKDATTTARTITWPTTIEWDGGLEPTLTTINHSGEAQIFKLCTTTNGETWYGKEVYKNQGGFRLFRWGQSDYGQLGLNDRTSLSSPVQVGDSSAWSSVTGNGTQQLATKVDGTLWTWGASSIGGLGLNNQVHRSSPTQVGTDTTWNRTFPNGSYSGAATKTDGTLWVWGNNLYGVLGQNGGQPTSQSSPVQLPGTWSALSNSGGGVATMGLQTNGTLWSWGYNTYGGLGLNDVVSRSSPTQVGTDTTWKEGIGTGFGFFAAVKTNGTLWTAGYNTTGQLGLNQEGTPARRSSPTQVGTDTTWNKVDSSGSSSIATKTDGTLWSWGYNLGAGQLGLNDIVSRSSPTQVGTQTTWDSLLNINAGYIATKTDGTLWSWGINSHGQLGHNQPHNTKISSPTQITGTWDISTINAMYSNYGGNAFQS